MYIYIYIYIYIYPQDLQKSYIHTLSKRLHHLHTNTHPQVSFRIYTSHCAWAQKGNPFTHTFPFLYFHIFPFYMCIRHKNISLVYVSYTKFVTHTVRHSRVLPLRQYRSRSKSGALRAGLRCAAQHPWVRDLQSSRFIYKVRDSCFAIETVTKQIDEWRIKCGPQMRRIRGVSSSSSGISLLPHQCNSIWVLLLLLLMCCREVYIYKCEFIRVYICICEFIRVYIYICEFLEVYIYTCEFIDVYMCVYMYEYIYVYTCV